MSAEQKQALIEECRTGEIVCIVVRPAFRNFCSVAVAAFRRDESFAQSHVAYEVLWSKI